MNARPALKEISKSVVEAYKKVYQNALVRVYLYGSYSRGEESSESDIDYLAVIDGSVPEIKAKLRELWNLTTDINLERNVVISAMVDSTDMYNKRQHISPYFFNVSKDGVTVYDRAGTV